MKSKRNWAVGLFLAAVMGVGVVYAANVHLKGEPTVTDLGERLEFCASLAGLGNQDVTITMTIEGSGTTQCINPAGFAAPGQNKVPVNETVSQTFRRTEIKNGNVTFCVTSPEPGRISAREAGCPNKNWTAEITDVEFFTATITVEQGGRTVLQDTFEFDSE